MKKYRLKRMWIVIVLTIVFILPSLLFSEAIGNGAPYGSPNQPYDRMPGTLVTPHISWANPYYDGKMKILVISPTWASRETVELAERLSMDYKWLMTYSHNHFGEEHQGSNLYDAVDQSVLDRLVKERLGPDEKYDLIIIGKVWDTFPDQVKESILKKVRAGTGLLLITSTATIEKWTYPGFKMDSENPKDFLTGMPIQMLPFASRPEQGQCGPLVVRTGHLGNGRVAEIDYNDGGVMQDGYPVSSLPLYIALTPYVEYDPLFYDYYYSIIARVALWVGNREPEVKIIDVVGQNTKIDRANLPASPIKFVLTRTLPGKGWYKLIYDIRDRENRIETKGSQNIAIEKTVTFSLSLPYLKRGLHVADLWVMKNKKIVTWASVFFHVVTGDHLVGFVLNKSYVKEGNPVTGKVILKNPLAKGVSLEIEVNDSYNRLVAKQTDNKPEFSFTIKNPLSKIYNITARLVDTNGVIEEKTTHFSIIPISRKIKNFHFIMWAAPFFYINRIILEQSAAYGVNAVYAMSLWGTDAVYEKSARFLSRMNLPAEPYMYGIWQSQKQGPNGPVEVPDISDMEFIKEMKKEVSTKAAAYVPYSTLAYSVAEECSLAQDGICLSPTCQADFIDYLQKKYLSLDMLNMEWGTTFQTWKDVKPITFIDAYKQNRYSQWMDYRLFMSDLWDRTYENIIKTIKKVDPQARVSLDVLNFSYGYSFDWGRILPQIGGFSLGGNSYLMEGMVRSFVGAKSVSGSWIGLYPGTDDEETMKYTPWHNLFSGLNDVMWWAAFNDKGLGGTSAFTPDVSEPLLCFRQASREAKEIERGIGTLLINSKRHEDPIAILYSQPSFFASYFSSQETTYEESLNDFITALDDAGFSGFHIITGEDIVRGNLNKYKVLILPDSQALSKEEIIGIKKFVAKGDLLFADFSPGIMDQHGKELKQSRLQKVFGSFTPLNINQYGKGRAVYLGNSLSGYSFQRKGLEADGRLGFVRMIKEYSGIVPQVQVFDKDGIPATGIEISTFENGKALYLGLLRGLRVKSVGTDTITVKLPGSYWVYNMRDNTFVGYTDTVVTTVPTGKARLFACLPEKVSNVQIFLNKKTYLQGEDVFYRVILPAELDGSGLGVRVEVFGPNGKNIPYYTGRFVTANAGFNKIVPLSLNEKPGIYRITATELASGLTATANFAVEKTGR
ncbi:MAG: beta-galactosidase [Candidatus Omnitrophica bacterium]|nr:beta-galactosidase [Candidatus Omnitrophota bacterium]